MPEPTATNPRSLGSPSPLSTVITLAGFGPLVVAYFVGLWEVPWYRAFPAILLAALLLGIGRMWTRPAAANTGASWYWPVVVACAVALLAVASVLWSPHVGYLAALLALVGFAGWAGGWPLVRNLAPSWILLLVVMQPPFRWDERLMAGLDQFVLRGADQMLYSFMVPHLWRPNGFELPSRTIPLAELLSGVRHLPGVLLLALVWLLWRRRGLIRMLVALLSVAAFALAGEVLRVAWGVEQSDLSGTDFFRTSRADVFSGVLWALSLGLMFSVEALTRFFAEARRSSGDAPPASLPTAPRQPLREVLGVSGKPGQWARGLAIAAGLLGLAQLALAWRQANGPATAPLVSRLPANAVLQMPSLANVWVPLPPDRTLATIAPAASAGRVWHWQGGQITLAVALDGPWRGFAEAQDGYTDLGWKIVKVQPSVSATNNVPSFVEVEMERDPMLKALLCYAVFDESGRWLEPPGHNAAEVARAGAHATGTQAAYRVQVLAASARPFTAANREDVRRAFEVARQTLAAQVTRLTTTK